MELHCHHLKCVCVGRGILCTIWGGGGIPNATLSPQRGEVERYLMLHCHHKEGRWNDT